MNAEMDVVDRISFMKSEAVKAEHLSSFMMLMKKLDNFDSYFVCAYEGEDYKYYASRIDEVLGSKSSELSRVNHPCGGKKKLIEIRELVQKNLEIKNIKIIYFIDKDYDESIFFDDVYETPCYSIENLYINRETLSSILKDHSGVCPVLKKDLLGRILSLFDHCNQLVDSVLLEVNQWIYSFRYYMKDKDVDMRNKYKIVLSDVDIYSIFNMDIPRAISKKEDVDFSVFFLKRKSEEFRIECHDFNTSAGVEYYSDKKISEYGRGKFKVKFFIKFITYLIGANNMDKEDKYYLQEKIKIKGNLSESDFISTLSQHATTPVCLIRFLNKNIPC